MAKSAYQDSQLYKIRHSAAHLLAMAALEYDPKVKLTIGPPIEDGFYYDFEFSKPFSDEQLEKFENRINQLIEQDLPVKKKLVNRKEAIKTAQSAGQEYKVELMREIEDDKLSFYGIGDFWDLCRGPHVKSTGEIKAVKLLSVAGAYWRGNEANKMLTRIYGTAFGSKKELANHLKQLELAKTRDHRKLGKELGIFTIIPEIGSGLPVWLPKGATIYRLLIDYIRSLEIAGGYQHVITNELGKIELYKTSGHLDHYRDSMYPPIHLEDETFILRPMNCPHHIQIYRNAIRSYRDLPYRLAEFGEVFRLEKSGELFGLQRVRAFNINDAHIFTSEDQIVDEVSDILKMIKSVYRKLNLKDYWFQLSLRGQGKKDKYGGADESWRRSEQYLKIALKQVGVDFEEVEDEAAFYGPKIDVQMENIHGKEETISTIQVDFYLPERFGLEFIDKTGQPTRPVMIHRAILGSMERFIGIYLEKTGGELPFWLSPVQAKIISLSEKSAAYAKKVAAELSNSGIRVELDLSDSMLGKKIRQGELEKIPFLLVIGQKEEQSSTVTIRSRTSAKQETAKLDSLAETLEKIAK